MCENALSYDRAFKTSTEEKSTFQPSSFESKSNLTEKFYRASIIMRHRGIVKQLQRNWRQKISLWCREASLLKTPMGRYFCLKK